MIRRSVLLVAALWSVTATNGQAQDCEPDALLCGPEVFLVNTPFTVTLYGMRSVTDTDVVVRLGNGTIIADTTVPALDSVILNGITVASAADGPVEVVANGEVIATLDQRVLPGWLSILPPLLAIVLALVFREVVTSLFAGIWLGAFFLAGFDPVGGIFLAANRFARGALADPDRAAIILFTMMLGGMVAIITRMGGMQAIVDAVTPLATNRRRGQLASWAAGLVVFFDDYANTLVVGNTMRPLTDRLKISREKLAYIVDSTAAPVAALFFISTWIGYEVSMIDTGLGIAAQQQAGNAALVQQIADASPFQIFLSTIPFLFYPILAIVAVAAFAAMGRDFGPMLKAEQRAASGAGLYRPGAQLTADMSSDLSEAEGAPSGRWWNGALPVIVLVTITLWGLVSTGRSALPDGYEADSIWILLKDIFGDADPYSPLMWGSIAAVMTALALAAGQKILPLGEGIRAMIDGMRAMLLAIIVLVMAWSLGEVTAALETAPYLSRALSDVLPPALLPVSVFLVSAAVAFATGTSWATMAIMLPLVVPLAINMVGTLDFASSADAAVVLGGIGSVLAGAIMGDHCSPISDTTVLSSTASSCDHVDHVRTQLPYALTVSAIAIVFGSIPSALGVPAWISLVLGAAVVIAVVRFVGKRPDEIAA